MIEDVLKPLFDADGGGIELVGFDEAKNEVVLRLTGAFRGDPGTPYVQAHVVKPAIGRALGRDARITYIDGGPGPSLAG